MRVFAGLLVLASLAVCSTVALPARNPNDDAEVVNVPRNTEKDDDDFAPGDFDGVVDTGSGYPFLSPVPHNFGLNFGFFDSFEDILKRFRARLWPAVADSSDESGEVAFPSLGLEPPKGGNTTSVVKVVNGHKVEINDTVYSKGDDNTGAVFKFRVINIRPLDEDEAPVTSSSSSDDDASTIDKGSPEVLEKTNADNEINANVDDPEKTTLHFSTDSPQSTDSTDIVETNPTEPIDSTQPSTESPVDNNGNSNEYRNEMEDALPTKAFHNDDSQSVKRSTENSSSDESELESDVDVDDVGDVEAATDRVRDSDWQPSSAKLTKIEHNEDIETTTSTRVEQADNNRWHHPLRTEFSEEYANEDAETETATDSDERHYENRNSEWDTAEDRDDNNSLDNTIDNFEKLPIDLSNDIAVNDILEAQDAPFDPDAEVFSVDDVVPARFRKPEKITFYESIKK